MRTSILIPSLYMFLLLGFQLQYLHHEPLSIAITQGLEVFLTYLWRVLLLDDVVALPWLVAPHLQQGNSDAACSYSSHWGRRSDGGSSSVRLVQPEIRSIAFPLVTCTCHFFNSFLIDIFRRLTNNRIMVTIPRGVGSWLCPILDAAVLLHLYSFFETDKVSSFLVMCMLVIWVDAPLHKPPLKRSIIYFLCVVCSLQISFSE